MNNEIINELLHLQNKKNDELRFVLITAKGRRAINFAIKAFAAELPEGQLYAYCISNVFCSIRIGYINI